jgi:hypothetical protein
MVMHVLWFDYQIQIEVFGFVKKLCFDYSSRHYGSSIVGLLIEGLVISLNPHQLY